MGHPPPWFAHYFFAFLFAFLYYSVDRHSNHPVWSFEFQVANVHPPTTTKWVAVFFRMNILPIPAEIQTHAPPLSWLPWMAVRASERLRRGDFVDGSHRSHRREVGGREKAGSREAFRVDGSGCMYCVNIYLWNIRIGQEFLFSFWGTWRDGKNQCSGRTDS